jgi:hypothetical protein
MSTVNSSTNPQIDHDDSTTPFESDRKKIDSLADDMAAKAGKVEHQSEKTSDPVGGVSSNSGGLFTK